MKLDSLKSLDTVTPSKEGAWYPVLASNSETIFVGDNKEPWSVKILGYDSIEVRSAYQAYYKAIESDDQEDVMKAQAVFVSEVVSDWKNGGDEFTKEGLKEVAEKFPFIFIQVFQIATDRKSFLALKESQDS